MNIEYIQGDATQPVGDGSKVIVHVCNDIGAWGAGFVLALSARWPEPEAAYRRMASTGFRRLGYLDFVSVEQDIYVANMIAQNGIGRGSLRRDALERCLGHVQRWAVQNRASVHMPLIGCGLAGDTWDAIEPIVRRSLDGVHRVCVYYLGEAPDFLKRSG